MKQVAKAAWMAVALSVVAAGVFFSRGRQDIAAGAGRQFPEDSILKSEDISYKNGKVYLDFVFKKPVDCNVAMDVWKIDSLQVKGKTFVPTCEQVQPDHIRISYTEQGEFI